MFTYVKVHNFKSLKNITFNFKKTKNEINKLVVLYGENGCGKTNIVQIFDFLQKSILSKMTDKFLGTMSKDFLTIKMNNEYNIKNPIKEIFDSAFTLNNYRMINEDEPTEVEYGFKIDNTEGYYYIKFIDKIIEEKLYYKVNRQKGILFEIKQKSKIDSMLNNTIFINKKYNKELEEEIQKYWGKYSFMSIMHNEMLGKNNKYIKNNISVNMLKVLREFIKTDVHVEKDYDLNLASTGENKLRHIENGSLPKDEENKLNKYEEILRMFFTQAYSDIKDVGYEKKEYEDDISYKLYFEKMIGDKRRKIPYDCESSGTRRIIKQFNKLIGAIEGRTAVIDEIDSGIHDVLLKNIIMSIKDEITGQLIMTTHNTLLLEVLPKQNIYFMEVDYNGNKQVNCIKEYNIQKNNNARDLYFKGVFGAIPMSDYIDFEAIKSTLDEVEKEQNND